MPMGSPTRPLSGRSILSKRRVWTLFEVDGMPRTNVACCPSWCSDPTRQRALMLIAAQRPRRAWWRKRTRMSSVYVVDLINSSDRRE